MMKFLRSEAHPHRLPVFKSAWLHTLTQVVWAVALAGEDAKYLPLLLASAPGIFYLPFQFPLTGLLLVWAHERTQRWAAARSLLQRLLVASLLFVLVASLLVWVVVLLSNVYRVGAQLTGGAFGALAIDSLLLTGRFVVPVFFLGEIFRQTWMLRSNHFEEK